jgi:cytoskeletal protein RodZ
MDESSFGRRLRREREQRGVSLEDISAATRISMRVLEGFENEKWDRLPGGFFNRGFLRSIARYLLIDEEELLAAYAATANDSLEARAAAAAEIPSGHPNIVWISAGALLLAAALAAGGWLAYRRSRPHPARGAITHPATPTATMAKPRS